ncbi:hypothetical protein TrVE_jg957 [Triparma verrucosa]|uniref:PNPLA domain-containing protein n=1 Tax=Triparma verrucosa TaxID=1606542 RepID=A0A9W7FIT4_9STRA|nr:hypothetical protein TrVE_jg957 [Triparma verrucosa]
MAPSTSARKRSSRSATRNSTTSRSRSRSRSKSRPSKKSKASQKATSPSLDAFMSSQPYSLSFSPSFFGFYSYMGLITALSPTPVSTSGASAGAMAAAAVASSSNSFKAMLDLKLSDVADFFPFPLMFRLGLFRGEKFENLLKEGYSPNCPTIESCPIPLAISVFDLRTLSSHILTSGSLSKAARASSTFPGLFAPVYYTDWCDSTSSNTQSNSSKLPGYLIDGGIKDVWGAEGVKHLIETNHPSFKNLKSKRLVLVMNSGVVSSNLSMPMAEDFYVDELFIVVIRCSIKVGPMHMGNGKRVFEAVKKGVEKARVMEAIEKDGRYILEVDCDEK